MSTESTVAPQIPYISPTSSLLDPDATFGQQGTRVCSTCKRVQLPTNQKWKRCPPCREKSREYRKRHLARVALATIQIPNENSPVTTGKRKEREDEEREDEDKADRLDRMKKKMRKHFADKPIGSSEHTSLPVTQRNNNSDYVEYQTARDMYEALKKNRSSSAIQFCGHFSIVAVAEIDHEHRLHLVVQELRKIAKWSFDRRHPMSMSNVPRSGTESPAKSVSTAYYCTCRKDKAVDAAQTTLTRPNSLLTTLATGTAPAPEPLKRKQSDLTEWVKKKSGACPSDAAPTATCQGKLKVFVEEDKSHPLKGIKGQKITVTIAH